MLSLVNVAVFRLDTGQCGVAGVFEINEDQARFVLVGTRKG